MTFYAEKLSGLVDSAGAAEAEDLAEGEDTVQEEVEGDLPQADIADQPDAHTDGAEEGEETE